MQYECDYLKYNLKRDEDGFLESVPYCSYSEEKADCKIQGDWDECPLNPLSEGGTL